MMSWKSLQEIWAFSVFLLAVVVVAFNTLVAPTPTTVPGPPLRAIPEDIFNSVGWAEQNYVAQGRYLEKIFGAFTVIVPAGQPVPAPVFFSGVARFEIIHLNESVLRDVNTDWSELLSNPIMLFPEGSSTDCRFLDSVQELIEVVRCPVQVLLPNSEGASQAVGGGRHTRLVAIYSPENGLLLVPESVIKDLGILPQEAY